MLRLRDEHEFLRDSLFYYLFSDHVVFDDIDSALSYLHDGAHPPAVIYTKDGIKIERNGMFDPSQRDNFDNLEYIYGELLRPPQGLAKANQGKVYD